MVILIRATSTSTTMSVTPSRSPGAARSPSFGCTSSQMLLGKRPYESIRNDYHIPSVVARYMDPYAWDSVDPFYEVLRSCLVHDPFRPATSSDVIKRLEVKLGFGRSAVAPPENNLQPLEGNERNLTNKLQIEDRFGDDYISQPVPVHPDIPEPSNGIWPLRKSRIGLMMIGRACEALFH
ncbi:uncharacterized protein EI90DRAFT_954808 [Cantharellus anzutake]|uniref:uncharacterized protein n=1 Tax=Cantharellus anzutake TaxID=1750568 RepID=UPI0019073976|nr:uncharacterized protein EI90DRAFT_954808 [Cantharellus anzutake]KAF8331645.1 hypothetical protein EI90DRAFT_954808 [Cantharellus anzutake]